MPNRSTKWSLLVVANVLTWCVLGFYHQPGAAQQRASLPFSNSVEQRNEMIRQLAEIRSLLKEQNELLKAATRPKHETPRK